MTSSAKRYCRVMLGRQSVHGEYLADGFIGGDFGIDQDLSDQLPEEWQQFNAILIPIFLAGHSGKSNIAAGLTCGTLWTVAKGIQEGDIVLCLDRTGRYHVVEVPVAYHYAPGPFRLNRPSRTQHRSRRPGGGRPDSLCHGKASGAFSGKESGTNRAGAAVQSL